MGAITRNGFGAVAAMCIAALAAAQQDITSLPHQYAGIRGIGPPGDYDSMRQDGCSFRVKLQLRC